MKWVGMLVVSLRGVSFDRSGLHAKKYKNIYLICIFFPSLLGVKKSLVHAQYGLL